MTSHGVGVATPILGINSAPEHSVGFFWGPQGGGEEGPRRGARRDYAAHSGVAHAGRPQWVLSQPARADDALFCQQIPAATSRYILTVRARTAASWRKSRSRAASGSGWRPARPRRSAARRARAPLTSRRIQYVVREPYTPTGGASRWPEAPWAKAATSWFEARCTAKLFLDGPHVVHEAGLGDLVGLRRSDETLTVLGLARAPGAAAREAHPVARRPRRGARSRDDFGVTGRILLRMEHAGRACPASAVGVPRAPDNSGRTSPSGAAAVADAGSSSGRTPPTRPTCMPGERPGPTRASRCPTPGRRRPTPRLTRATRATRTPRWTHRAVRRDQPAGCADCLAGFHSCGSTCTANGANDPTSGCTLGCGGTRLPPPASRPRTVPTPECARPPARPARRCARTAPARRAAPTATARRRRVHRRHV